MLHSATAILGCSPKTETFAVELLCFWGSSSALQWYSPLSAMVMFGRTKVLLIGRITEVSPFFLIT